MEISGKIIAVLPLTSGQGRNGMWRAQDYVLETQEQYPRKVCFNLFGDKIDTYPMEVGDMVEVSFDIESREYNGRWYTSVRAWKVVKNAVNPAPVAAAATTETGMSSAESAPNPLEPSTANPADDLPF